MKPSKKKFVVALGITGTAALTLAASLLGKQPAAPSASQASGSPSSTVTSAEAIETAAPLLAPGHELKLDSRVESEAMTTLKYQDTWLEPATGERIEVVGSMSFVHRTERGEVVTHKLAHWQRPLGAPMPRYRAVALAVASLAHAGHPASDEPRLSLKVLPNPDRTDARLVYWADFADRLVILDAESGELVNDLSKHRTVAAMPKIRVHNAQGQGVRTKKYGDDVNAEKLPDELKNVCQLISLRKDSKGNPILINPDQCTLAAENSELIQGADIDSKRALENSRIVARYYAEKHQRSSYDNQGSELVSVVHVGDHFDNAFWDEERGFMAYGDGDGKSAGSYTAALDIVGHEITHGVTAATAKLIGSGESGALNEAYSDFFGTLISNEVERDPDWTIGKDVSPGEDNKEAGMRSLAQPGKFKTSVYVDAEMTEQKETPYPSHMSERLAVGQECSDKNDQCEVHGNSTIPGHASYLIAKALEDKSGPAGNRYDRAGTLYYTVLTQYLTANDGFTQAANDTLEACKLLYSATDCSKVQHAFELTGMLRSTGGLSPGSRP